MRIRMLFGMALVLCAAYFGSTPVTMLAANEVATIPIVPGIAMMDDCLNCYNCEADNHDAEDGDPEYELFTRNGGAHLDNECRTGTCDEKHYPICYNIEQEPLTDAILEDLRVAVVANDARGISKFLGSFENQIAVNTPRAAIQVMNCSGGVVVHMPVSQQLLEAIQTASLTQ